MIQAEKNRFTELYQRHLRLLKLQGKSQKTIDSYSRAVRRISEHFNCSPDQLTLEQREEYFFPGGVGPRHVLDYSALRSQNEAFSKPISSFSSSKRGL
jgi:Phage integrase, N-terminal SAM-like domain